MHQTHYAINRDVCHINVTADQTLNKFYVSNSVFKKRPWVDARCPISAHSFPCIFDHSLASQSMNKSAFFPCTQSESAVRSRCAGLTFPSQTLEHHACEGRNIRGFQAMFDPIEESGCPRITNRTFSIRSGQHSRARVDRTSLPGLLTPRPSRRPGRNKWRVGLEGATVGIFK